MKKRATFLAFVGIISFVYINTRTTEIQKLTKKEHTNSSLPREQTTAKIKTPEKIIQIKESTIVVKKYKEKKEEKSDQGTPMSVPNHMRAKLELKIIKENKQYKNSKITISKYNSETKIAMVIIESTKGRRPSSFTAQVNRHGKILQTWGTPIYEDFGGRPNTFGLPTNN